MSQAIPSALPGHHEAFLTFIQPYCRLIRHTIRRVCGAGASDLQADIEQDVYLTLWEHWTPDRRIDHPVAYLYKVALRTALAARRTLPATIPVDEMECAAWARHAMAQDPTLTTEHALLLTTCLAHLPAEQACAVRAYLEGFTQREIAQRYGWSGAVTRHRIYRGLHALQAYAVQEAA